MHGKTFEPGPDEIRKICQQIQAQWSDKQERQHRRPLGQLPWMLPNVSLVHIYEIEGLVNAEEYSCWEIDPCATSFSLKESEHA